MSVANKTCATQAILNYNDEKVLWKHGQPNKAIKCRLISALKQFYASDFRSFIIYIGNPTDFWLAEAIWEMSETAENSDIEYTLVFITSFMKMQDEWIDHEKNWTDVIDKAEQVVWQKSVYPSETAELFLIDLTKDYGFMN